MSDTQKLHPIRIAGIVVAILAVLGAVVGSWAVDSYRVGAIELKANTNTRDIYVLVQEVDLIENEMIEQKVILQHIKKTTDILLERQ